MGGANNSLQSLATERLKGMQRNQIFLLHPIPRIARQVKISVDIFEFNFSSATNVREGFGGWVVGRVGRCGWLDLGNVCHGQLAGILF